MIFSFWVLPERLPQIQAVVKKYDLRFNNNPAAFIALGGSAYVEISYESPLNNDVIKSSMAEIDAIRNPPQPPKPKTVWQKIWAKLVG